MPAILKTPIRLTGAYFDPAKLQRFDSDRAIRLLFGAGGPVQTIDFTGGDEVTSGLFRPDTAFDGFHSGNAQEATIVGGDELWMRTRASANRYAVLFYNREEVADLDTLLCEVDTETTANYNKGLAWRIDPYAGTCYTAYLTGGSIDAIHIGKHTDGSTHSSLDSAVVTLDADTKYWMRLKSVASVHKLKVWKVGDSEPTAGGPDSDGYQLKVTDASYTAAGKIGFWIYSRTADYGKYDNFAYPGYDNSSPPIYMSFDSGQDDDAWAAGITTKENVQAWDDATALTYKVFYSNSDLDVTNAGDRATIDAGLSASWVTAGNVPEGTGRYRYLVARLVSDGSKAKSIAIYDDGQQVTVSAGDVTPPGIPTFKLNSVGDGKLNCEVTAIPNDADLDDLRPKYRIFNATTPNSWSDATDIAAAIGTTWAFSGLANGTQYEISLVAVDTSNNESDLGNVFRATPNDGSALTAAGEYSLVLENLRTLVANTPTFQTWTSTDNAEAAKAFIKIAAMKEAGIPWPYALITPGDAHDDGKIAGGASDEFAPSGSIGLEFGAAVGGGYIGANADDYHEEALWEFMNKVGAIKNEMKELAGQSGYLMVKGFSQRTPPSRAGEDISQTYKDYYFVELIVDWGF